MAEMTMNDYTEDIRRYLEQEREVLAALDEQEISAVMNVLEHTRLNGNRVFICGNGGSASTASHLECDFNKGISYDQKVKYDIECLSDNVPMMMAIANDMGYDEVFVVPLKNKLKKGDVVYNCHIPSGSPLAPEAVMDSLRRAHAFYQPENGVLPVICHSWLLYPPHKKVFPPASNLLRFAEMFDVTESEVSPDYNDFWRIFHCPYHASLKNLPRRTELQRNFAAYLQQGNQMGLGLGVLLFDGKTILNR